MKKVSVVIPVLNEEAVLSNLLESLQKQTFNDYEIIIADAGSKDKTVEIALDKGTIVVKGGKPGVGRNKGAEVATGEYLFFLDADVILPEDFIKNAVAEMEERKLDLATCEFLPDSNLPVDSAVYGLANLFVQMSIAVDPHAPGFCILVRKEVFEEIGGFDENLALAEDHNFVKRAAKEHSFGYLKNCSMTVSVRRLDKEGRLQYAWKCIQVEFYRMFKGDPTEEIVEYEFANFDEKKEGISVESMKELPLKIKQLGEQYKEKLYDFTTSDNINEKESFQQIFNTVSGKLKDMFITKE